MNGRYEGVPEVTCWTYGQNAYGSVMFVDEAGEKHPIICGHGGTGWFCLDCAKKAIAYQHLLDEIKEKGWPEGATVLG